MNLIALLRRSTWLALPVLTGSLALGAQSPAAKAAPATDPVVITVGSQTIRASQFEAIINASPAAEQASMRTNKRTVGEQLAKLLALAEKGKSQGLDRSPAVQAEVMMANANAVADAVVSKLQASAKPTDAQVQAYYKAHPQQFAEAKVRHILIADNETPGSPSSRTPAQALAKANSLEAQLKKGADFATLAKANSDDTGSKAKGGELGEVLPGQTVPEFEAAVGKLAIGQVSQPVHSRYGYHIIEVESRSTVPLAQAKAGIVSALTNQNISNQVDQIAASEHIVLNDSYFGPAKPAAPAASPAPAAK